MVSEQYDVESGNGEAFGVAMMRLDKSHPIHSCRESIGEISWAGQVTYLDREWGGGDQQRRKRCTPGLAWQATTLIRA